MWERVRMRAKAREREREAEGQRVGRENSHAALDISCGRGIMLELLDSSGGET